MEAYKEGIVLRQTTYVEEIDMSCVVSIDPGQESYMYIVAFDVAGELYLPETDELPTFRKERDSALKREIDESPDRHQPAERSFSSILQAAYTDPTTAAKVLAERMAAQMTKKSWTDNLKQWMGKGKKK